MARSTQQIKKHYGYFFLNGEVHRLLKVTVNQNLAQAYNFAKREHVVYLWSDVQSQASRAYSAPEVCKILGITRMTLWKYESQGLVPPPPISWKLGTNPDELVREYGGGPRVARRYDADAIMRIYDVMSYKKPDVNEVIAKLTNKQVLYYKNEDGEFRPLWEAPKW